jgi:putative proteasome-type protease
LVAGAVHQKVFICRSGFVMTYCLAISVNGGLVFASDSRTNAGVDHISIYPKMFVFDVPGRGYYVILTSGNLATSQSILHRIEHDLNSPMAQESLATMGDMSDAARYVGQIGASIKNFYAHDLKQGANFDCSVILGGQIYGKPHEIFLIYPEGNFIQSSPYVPFLQIGETKYGKPILDRIIHEHTSLERAARCALVSLDSTTRSNLTVAPPFDLLIYETGTFRASHRARLELNSPYYAELRKCWGEGLKSVFDQLPLFEWETPPAP